MIEIVPYDPLWPNVFASLRSRLTAALPDLALRVEHIGSTAVPGLAAKPIIDVTVVVDTLDHLPAVIGLLATLGYRHDGDLGLPGRESFTAPVDGPLHHLCVCAADHPNLASALAFRDYLRTHPDTARAYAELKYFLASRFRNDRPSYTAAKSAFISRVVATVTDS